ncbi:MAG: phosphomannomutase/phosphoglucomutase [Candidatus Hodarchaeales archaeon]|jgi:phosphomannomutase/phosphoglucomutase
MVELDSIFRTYDIRGKFPKDYNLETAVTIGKAFGKLFGINRNVIIGGDVRLSTPILKTALTLGLMESGCNVKDIGVCTTPTIYFLAANNTNVDFGIMITASHNPIDYNGIKVCDHNGVSYHFDNFFRQIKTLINQNNLTGVQKDLYGQVPLLDGVSSKQFWNFQKENFAPERPLDLVVDIGNGTCFPILELLTEKQMNVDALHSEPDGTFPVMIPDPAKPECLKFIISKMKSGSYDLGIGYDADGDRVGFVDDRGNILFPDQAIMLFGKYLIGKNPNCEIMIDIKTSRATYEYLTALGAKVRFTRVGHSWIHEEIMKSGVVFAGELSGHYYFKDGYFGFDDAAFSSLKMIEILTKQKRSISSIVEELPSYYSSNELRIPCEDNLKSAVTEKLKKRLISEAENCITIDGVRAEFEDGWVLIRESGTEPVISVRAEGHTQKRLEFYLEYVKDLVNEEIGRS